MKRQQADDNPSACCRLEYIYQRLLLLPGTFFRRNGRSICGGSRSLCRCIPVVQVVSNVMAVAAFGKTGQHTSRMRYAMTALAGRNHLVLLFVAGYTGYILVLCIGLAV